MEEKPKVIINKMTKGVLEELLALYIRTSRDNPNPTHLAMLAEFSIPVYEDNEPIYNKNRIYYNEHGNKNLEDIKEAIASIRAIRVETYRQEDKTGERGWRYGRIIDANEIDGNATALLTKFFLNIISLTIVAKTDIAIKFKEEVMGIRFMDESGEAS